MVKCGHCRCCKKCNICNGPYNMPPPISPRPLTKYSYYPMTSPHAVIQAGSDSSLPVSAVYITKQSYLRRQRKTREKKYKLNQTRNGPKIKATSSPCWKFSDRARDKDLSKVFRILSLGERKAETSSHVISF